MLYRPPQLEQHPEHPGRQVLDFKHRSEAVQAVDETEAEYADAGGSSVAGEVEFWVGEANCGSKGKRTKEICK